MAANDKKLVRSKSGLRIVTINEDATSPLMLSEPPWIPDNECRECLKCQGKFDFMKRRHHCRRCGQVLCGNCCNNKLALPRMCFIDPVRQCVECAIVTKKENDFFERHLKTLVAGADFHISSSDGVIENAPIYICKLSSDHRFIKFDGGDEETDLEEVELRQVLSVKILTSGTDSMGNAVATGVAIRHKDATEEILERRMIAVEGTTKRQGMLWVAAMQKAMKLIYASKTGSP